MIGRIDTSVIAARSEGSPLPVRDPRIVRPRVPGTPALLVSALVIVVAGLAAWRGPTPDVAGPSVAGVLANGPAAIVPDVADPGAAIPDVSGPPTSPTNVDAPSGHVAPATSPSTAPGALAEVPSSSLEPGMALLGTATIQYVVGRDNGGGANIEIPLRAIDGSVLAPGARFDFWRAIGEVSTRTGYRRGAIIAGDHIDHQGALAGGICTVSTAIFDAAVRAGLDITSRHSHGGYISRYPPGLDAAVSTGDGGTMTLAFRNDTTEPITIRTVSTPGIARVDLYGPTRLGRVVTVSDPVVRHRTRARDVRKATTGLSTGETRRIDAPSDGMTVVVRRTVVDASGTVLHTDRWTSVYRPLRGLVLVGRG